MYFTMGKKYRTEDYSDRIMGGAEREALNKYRSKYWGKVGKEEWELNELRLVGQHDGPLIGRYANEDSVEFLIITIPEINRTIFLTASEYDDGKLDEIIKLLAKKKSSTEEMLKQIRRRDG